MSKEREQRQVERARRVATFTTFVVALVYGFAIIAALSNTAVLFDRLSRGEPVVGLVPIVLLAWGIIALVHFRRGWPPFRRR